jgi:RimK family alpha-L-glutamate ligase
LKGWLIYDAVGKQRNGWFIEQLCRAATKRGVDLSFVLASRLKFGVKDGKKALFLDGTLTPFPDFVICRTIFPLLSEFLEASGVKVFNSAQVSRICNDKRATHLYFADCGVQMADTFFLNGLTADASDLSYPAILKSVDGHGGKEVFWLSDPKDLAFHLQKMKGRDFLVQKPVTPGRDVRVYMLDGEILFSALRTCETDFRSNYSLGGRIAPYKPCEEMKRVAGIVYEQLKPFYVGIDFTFDSDGRPLLNEVEDVVGSRMLYQLTDLQLHELYIEKLIGKLNSL